MYSIGFSELTETENLPGNFRAAVAGKEMGINRIRWVHPTTLPEHQHDDAEQAVVVTSGRIELTVGGETLLLGEGDVAIIPRGIRHSGQSLEGEAQFIEIFAPLRLENLYGFLGNAQIAPEGQ